MPVVLIDLSIFPIDQGESLSPYVAQAIEVIVESGLPYRVGPMSTTIEGEYDRCMGVVRRCFDVMSGESDRVLIQIKVDYRRGREGALTSKIASIEGRLGRTLCS